MPASVLPTGKLPPELLDELLARHSRPDPRVVLGPRAGEDAAIIDMGDRYLVAKTDPITFATDEIGWYAVNVNANDIACCGAVPKWFLATLLLPEQRTDPALVERIFGQIAEACAALDVTLCGGHTEITYGLDRPIVVGQMLGEVAPDAYLTTSGARPGDALILTKGIAVEGTAIIASEKGAELAGGMSRAELDRCVAMLHDPGISVVPDANCAIAAGGVHALHDPTEGGVATGLWELARAAGVGVRVEEGALPVLEPCRALCRHFDLDPLGLIASGALLIAADPGAAGGIVASLAGIGIAASCIGTVVERSEGCVLRDAAGRDRALPHFDRDEIARLFSGG